MGDLRVEVEAKRDRAVPVLLLLSAIVFADSLSGAQELFQRDIHALWRPQMASFLRVVKGGALPLWNPYVAFGRPLLADPGYQALYPWTWTYLLLPASFGFALYAWLHVALCGIGVQRLSRTAGLSPLGALGAGCAAVLSGPLLSYVNLTFQLAGAAWLPWTVDAALRVWRRADRNSVLRLALALLLQVLAGSGEMIAAAAMVISVGAMVGCARRGLRRARLGLAALALAGLLGAGLAAVQWLPTLSLLRSSARVQLEADARGAWALHPARVLETAIPALFTDAPLRPAVQAALFTDREPLLNSVHIGAAVLVLALLAAVRGGGLVLATTGIAAFFTSAALGPHTPLWPLLSAGPLLPFRFPEKWMLPSGLAVAVLCGAGLDALGVAWSAGQKRRARVVLAVTGLTTVFTLGVSLTLRGAAWWLSIADGGADAALLRFLLPTAALGVTTALIAHRLRRGGPRTLKLAPALALGLVVVTLLPAARAVNPTTRASVLAFVPRAARLLASDGVDRLQSRPPSQSQIRTALARQGLDAEPVAALANMETLGLSTSATWGIDGAYDPDITGLGLPEHAVLSSAALQFAGSPLAERLLRLGAVTHVIAPDARPFPGFPTLATVPWIGGDPLVLLGVPEPRPRVLVVHRARAVASARDAITLLGDPTFDLTRETLLIGGPARDGVAAPSTCEVARRAADALDLRCTLAAEGIVVVADAWDAGWRATVDRAAAPVLRTDVLFRAVVVGAGTHDVRLRYRPFPVTAGALISLGAALAWAALALTRRRPG